MLRRFLFPALLALPLLAEGPAIAFDRAQVALGRISPGQKQRVVFKATNAGDAPLQISEVNPSCGCTTTLSGSLVLKPGEEKEIEALLDPQGMKGPIHKSLAVRSNDPRTPTALLTIEAEVVPEVQAVPEELFFSSVPRRGRPALVLRLNSSAGEELRVLEASSPAAFLTLTPRREAGAVLDVTVEGERIPAGLRSGQETLTVKTNSALMPTLTLPVYWVLQPSFSTAPADLSFGSVGSDRAHSLSLVLTQSEGRPFRVLRASTTTDRFRVSRPAAAAPRQTVTVTLPKGSPKGSWSEVLLVETDDPDEAMVAVPVRAEIH